MEKVLVTSYINPDMDGTACAVAYAEFLNKTGILAVAGLLGLPHEEALYVSERFEISLPLILSTDDFEKIVLVDVSELKLMSGKISPEKVIEIIDHREVGQTDEFVNAKKQIELVGSAATLVAEKFVQNNIEISKNSATLLLSAIVSNTLNFKGSVTTSRDRVVAEYLFGVSKLDQEYYKELFSAKSDMSGDKLRNTIMADKVVVRQIAGKRIVVPQLEIVGAKELLQQRLLEILETLDEMKKTDQLDFVFLNLVDLENICNFFVTKDIESQKLISKIYGLVFENNFAGRDGIILRKQIWPLIVKELENI